MDKNKDELKNLFTEYWHYMTVYTACKQNIFDLIELDANTITKLSSYGNFDEKVLSDLLLVLQQQGLLSINNGKLCLSNKGMLLTDNHKDSLKYACLNWGGEHLTAWQNLDFTLKSGKPSFEKIYKKPFFEYIADDKTKVNSYHKAMNEYARDDYYNICKIHDFSIHKSIMDVGGGLGALINVISKNNSDINCYLFDKPEVIDLIDNENYIKIKGDFFDFVPNVSDSIIMSRVIHDWDDSNVKQILDNVYEALPQGGNLYLIENLTNKISDSAAILSLNMHIMTNSKERSLDEYRRLLNGSYFKINDVKKINDFQYLIIGKK